MSELHELSALAQRDALRRGEVTSVELVGHYLERIAARGAAVGAFVEVTAERALAAAAEIDRTRSSASDAHRPILGLPFADKDLVARAGVPTRFGSRVMADHVPEASDPLVVALDAAGGVSLGKTATPEFGTPAYTEPLAGHPARTPWDLARGAGGSSGGAAAAVAAGLLPFAPGSDGGGSIRIPAAACGLVGLKPSRGRVPSSPGFDFPGGLVTAGPIARSVADAALLLDAMAPAGSAPVWATAPPGDGPFLPAATGTPLTGLRIGVTTASPWSSRYDIEVSTEASSALECAIATLRDLGHSVEALDWTPDAGYPDQFRVIWQAGPAALPIPESALGLLEPLTAWLRAEGRRRHAGELASAIGWLARFERDTLAAFAGVDAVLTPTLAVPPPLVGHYDAVDGERNFAQQCQVTPWTSFVNVCGLPAIQLPVLLTEPTAQRPALPMGVQLIGRPGGEATLLGIAAGVEAALGWDQRRPPVW